MAPFIGGALALIGGGVILGHARAGGFAAIPLLGGLAPWQMVLVTIGVLGLPFPLLMLLLSPDVCKPSHEPARGGLCYRSTLRHIRSELRYYLLLATYGTAGSMVAFGVGAWFPTLMSRKFAIPLPTVGLTAGPISLVCAIAGLFVCGMILNRLAAVGRPPLTYGIFALIIAATCAASLSLVPTARAAWVLFGVTVFFTGTFSVGATILAKLTPSTIMGKVSVIYLLCQSLIGAGAGPTLVAVISQKLSTGGGSIGTALSIYCAIVGLFGALVAMALFRALAVRAQGELTAAGPGA